MKTRLAVLALLLCSASFLYSQASAAPQQSGEKKELTVEAIFKSGRGQGGPENLKWSPDGAKVSFVERDETGQHGTLYYIDVATGKRAELVASSKLEALAPPTSAIKDERKKEAVQRYGVAAYHWAPDSKKLLFDSMGQLWLYSLDSGTALQLTSSADSTSDPKFSPDGSRLAYLRKHNLYVRPLGQKNEKQITKDGDENLLNGEVDWVYEEELYSRSNYFWSPDSRQILLLQMNEKDVPSYPITDWIPTHPTVDQEKYPKAGDPNPGVRLGVINAGGGKIKWLTAGGGKDGSLKLGDDPNVLIPRFGWVNANVIWAMALNRVQDRMDLYFVDVKNGKSQLMMTERSDAWIDMHPEMDFLLLNSGDRYLWTSWRDGHNHIYLYQFDKQNPLSGPAKLVAQLTKGDWEVESINGVDDAANLVYFNANKDDWRQSNVFAVGLDGQNLQRISKQDGSHEPDFDPKNAKYYVDFYSSMLKRPVLSLCSVGGSCNEIWRSKSTEDFGLLTPKFVDFKAADGTTTLQGVILLPTGGPMMKDGKAPLILNPYGGPGVQTIRDGWGEMGLFDQLLAKQGFAVLKVDNRGMSNRGKAFALPIKHHFGPTELADQIAATKQALQQFPQLDPNRIGFWGWSYGGYFTLYALEHSDMFKGGVAVAPVTDWRNYDTIYTERYMDLPQVNADGYKNSSPVNDAAEMHGKLLEVHGTSDDNVHMQNTIQMVNALINAGKQFQLMLYPQKTHGIGGLAARVHLFTMIDDHFLEILAPQ